MAEKLEKQNKTEEVVEVIAENVNPKPSFDADSFFDKYKQVLLITVAVIVLMIGSFIGYRYYVNSLAETAKDEIYMAVYYFEADSLDKALKGDKSIRGFLDIADEYGSSTTGNLANFYIGAIYLKKGKFDDAIEYLNKFGAGDKLIQARAYSLIGDAYMEKKEFDNAVSFYEKAASWTPNEQFTPRYLLKLALAYELNNDLDGALKAYDKIINDFSKASELYDAKKYKALVEAKKSNQ